MQSDSIHDVDGEATAPIEPSPPIPQERDEKGRFVEGNPVSQHAAVTHGLHALEVPAEFVHLQVEVQEFVANAMVDEGDLTQVPTRRLALIEYRARLHRRILQLDAAIELHGLFDKRGRLRVAWLSQLQSLIGAAKGIDSLLGLQKRTKRVPSAHELITGKSTSR